MAYCTKAQVKNNLAISASTDDTLIDDLIARAQKLIEEQTGRVFEASGDTTRYFDAVADVDGAMLTLDKDLCAITTVTNGDGVVVAASSYVTEPRNETPYWALRLKNSATISWTYGTTPENAISIVGKWAYSVAAPADVVLATVELTAYLYRRRGTEGVGLDRVTVSPSGITMMPGQIPENVKLVISKYQRPGRG